MLVVSFIVDFSLAPMSARCALILKGQPPSSIAGRSPLIHRTQVPEFAAVEARKQLLRKRHPKVTLARDGRHDVLCVLQEVDARSVCVVKLSIRVRLTHRCLRCTRWLAAR